MLVPAMHDPSRAKGSFPLARSVPRQANRLVVGFSIAEPVLSTSETTSIPIVLLYSGCGQNPPRMPFEDSTVREQYAGS